MIQVSVIQEVTGLKFTNNKMEMSVGSTAYPQIEVSPANASNPAITFSSDNTKIATVDGNGLIQGISKGRTTIRASAADGSGKTASMTLNVVQLPESITLDKTKVTVNTSRSSTVKATVLPKTANDRNVTWESTNAAIAKVSKDGQITGVKAGTCQVICRAKADDTVTATVDVTVQQPVTKITPNAKSVSLNVRETAQIQWTVGPEDATNPAVTLTSNKTSVATVDENGVINGIKRGECTITIKAADGSNKSATVKVSVLQPVEGVYMKEGSVQTDVEDKVRLNAVLVPSDASNTKMIWHSMDETIATVSGTGTRPTVTGHRWGPVEIIGYTDDGGFSASAWVTVENYNTAIRATDLYLDNNTVKLALINVSNLTVSRVEFTVECYDIYNVPIACNVNGSNAFDGIYQYTLREGESTRHGRFNFIDYMQPAGQIGRVLLTITAYRVQEGWRYDIPANKMKTIEYVSPAYIGEIPVEEPEPYEEPLPYTEPDPWVDYTVTEDDYLPDPVG